MQVDLQPFGVQLEQDVALLHRVARAQRCNLGHAHDADGHVALPPGDHLTKDRNRLSNLTGCDKVGGDASRPALGVHRTYCRQDKRRRNGGKTGYPHGGAS